MAAVVGIIALVAATVVVTNGLLDDEASPPPSSTSSSSAPTSLDGGTSQAGADADGCLGGVNPSKAVLKAQKEADLDTKGAAGFAATVMRWRSQYPVDPAYVGKAKQIMTPDAGSDLLTADPSEGGPEDSGWGTTDGARYRVTENTQTTATVEITLPFFVTSKEYPEGVEVYTGARWRLTATDGKWRVADMDGIAPNSKTRDEIESHGLTFEGAC